MPALVLVDIKCLASHENQGPSFQWKILLVQAGSSWNLIMTAGLKYLLKNFMFLSSATTEINHGFLLYGWI